MKQNRDLTDRNWIGGLTPLSASTVRNHTIFAHTDHGAVMATFLVSSRLSVGLRLSLRPSAIVHRGGIRLSGLETKSWPPWP